MFSSILAHTDPLKRKGLCHERLRNVPAELLTNGNGRKPPSVMKIMFLHRLTDYPLSDLLHSFYGVAVCQLDPEPLKNTICELLNRGHHHLVLEATDGSLWLLVPASGTND